MEKECLFVGFSIFCVNFTRYNCLTVGFKRHLHIKSEMNEKKFSLVKAMDEDIGGFYIWELRALASSLRSHHKSRTLSSHCPESLLSFREFLPLCFCLLVLTVLDFILLWNYLGTRGKASFRRTWYDFEIWGRKYGCKLIRLMPVRNTRTLISV